MGVWPDFVKKKIYVIIIIVLVLVFQFLGMLYMLVFVPISALAAVMFYEAAHS